MRFVLDWVLPHYVANLETSLRAILPRLPARRHRRLTQLLAQPLEARRLNALHGFANLAEAEGWLDPAEAITIRKLAYRVSFYLRRAEQDRSPGPPRRS
jgi:hypothetical protein